MTVKIPRFSGLIFGSAALQLGGVPLVTTCPSFSRGSHVAASRLH